MCSIRCGAKRDVRGPQRGDSNSGSREEGLTHHPCPEQEPESPGTDTEPEGKQGKAGEEEKSRKEPEDYARKGPALPSKVQAPGQQVLAPPPPSPLPLPRPRPNGPPAPSLP